MDGSVQRFALHSEEELGSNQYRLESQLYALIGTLALLPCQFVEVHQPGNLASPGRPAVGVMRKLSENEVDAGGPGIRVANENLLAARALHLRRIRSGDIYWFRNQQLRDVCLLRAYRRHG